jgi:poly(3-hydroxybutyrate) depolymerase
MNIARFVVALIVSVPALAACDRGDSPKPAPLPSITASGTPTPTQPPIPGEARGLSTISAKAFIRYWIQVFNYAASTGDTSPLRAISAHQCHSCANLAEKIENTYSAGGHTEGSGWSVEDQRFKTSSDIRAVIRAAPLDVWASATAQPEHFKGGPRRTKFGLLVHDGGWIMGSLEFL